MQNGKEQYFFSEISRNIMNYNSPNLALSESQHQEHQLGAALRLRHVDCNFNCLKSTHLKRFIIPCPISSQNHFRIQLIR